MSKFHIFQKVGKTRIVPISFRLVVVFMCMILLSNLATNFISLKLSQGKMIALSNQIMVQQLKDIFTTASNQFAVSKFSGKSDEALNLIGVAAKNGFNGKHSMAMGITPKGEISFFAFADEENHYEKYRFADSSAIVEKLNADFEKGKQEGSIHFDSQIGKYFGVYKFSSDWNCYIIRAELTSDTRKAVYQTYFISVIFILVVTVIFMIVGLVMFSQILKNVRRITESLYEMQQNQKLTLIDLSESPNDDISYLGASFNSLSSTISNLMGIFQKFASKDVVSKAYRDHYIELAGKQRELTILFSDIRGFTYMTETLGNEITSLLNIHYDRVIHQIHESDGIIGSIIGDAVLAVYGAMDESTKNKSLEALDSGWAISRVTAELRARMIERRAEIEKERALTEVEERVYKAVLLDVGVGIDGGKVFYGNIGSSERMTNTVIGDNVNSASRLEGLTRVYSLPVIVSEYVKDDIETVSDKYKFYEIDTVQVKGKTEGKKIYLPLEINNTDSKTMTGYDIFEEALQLYYKGDWPQARKKFREANVSASQAFLTRMGLKQAPENWSGIWTMTTK